MNGGDKEELIYIKYVTISLVGDNLFKGTSL